MSLANRTSLNIEVMTVKGYADDGYILGRLEFNKIDYFIAPWYGPVEGFYSKLPVGTNVLTKKIPGETRLCHIMGIDRNTIEDTVGILSGLPNEKTLNTLINPREDVVSVFKRGVGKLEFSDENISLMSSSMQGFKILGMPNSIENNLVFIGDSSINFDNGSDSISGRLFLPKKRSSSGIRLTMENLGKIDESILSRFRHVGIYPESRVSEIEGMLNLARNYNRKTYRHMGIEFVGFDAYYDSIRGAASKKIGEYRQLESDPFYRHFFLPNESSFSINGGIFSKLGYEYDLNFNEVRYGSFGKRPNSEKDVSKTENLFGRGISFAFSINNSVFRQSDIKSSTFEDNTYVISDREGLTKIKLNKSSFKGNLPVRKETSYGESLIKDKNPKERNPIVFIKADGTTIPNTIKEERDSGIRFSEVSSFNKSGTDSEFRASITSHHNMVATAEQLLAAFPYKIVPSTGGGHISASFEHWIDDGGASEGELKNAGADSEGELSHKAVGSSFILVGPTEPALKSGGSDKEYFVSGLDRSEEKPFSNTFKSAESGEATPDDSFESAGGYSMLLETAGAVVASIGRTDADGVSAIIDTSGGVISWFGSDNNGRSIVTQTDGSINICVGGPSLNLESSSSFNKGRLDIKVNILNKGTVGAQGNVSSGDEDYRISISEKGLIISGGKRSAPMVISSNGNLNLESLHGDVNIVANEGSIKYKTGSGEFNDITHRDTESRSLGTYLKKAEDALNSKVSGQ